MASARNLLGSLSLRQKVALAGSVVGVLLVAFFLVRLAGKPTYATVVSGVDPAETGKITAALDERGIPYELQNNGTALAVDKSKTAEARIALAEQGLPGRGQPGMELFDNQKLGASDFQQQVNYQRALEGEIARTIEQVDGVSGAQVSLVLPEDELFAEEGSPATAAVLLTGDSANLDPASVRGMAQLVASSVKGLKPANVSITDGTGTLLWPKEAGGAPGEGSVTNKQAVDARYEGQLEGKLNAMLAQTIGPGKARVQVKADVNTDEATEDKLTYGKRGTALRQRAETERLRGSGGTGRGTSGTAGNIPTYAQGGNGNSNYQRETEERDLGVPKTVRRTKLAPGRLERQSVSLVLDQSVPAGDVPELRRAIEGAAGIDTERGDALEVSQVAFARPAAPPAPGPVAGALGYARWVGLGLALLAFLFFVARHLRRREQEALGGGRAWLSEIEEPLPLASLEPRAVAPRQDETVMIAQQENQRVRKQVEQFAEREPERVAQQLQAWMADA